MRGLIVVAMVVLAGCSNHEGPVASEPAPKVAPAVIADAAAGTPEPQVSPAPPARSEDAADLNLPPLESVVTEGTPYTLARDEILLRSFAPKSNRSCVENVGGAAAQSLCTRLPELDACSGDGYCKMVFRRWDGKELEVNTYGDIASVLSDTPDVAVRSVGMR